MAFICNSLNLSIASIFNCDGCRYLLIAIVSISLIKLIVESIYICLIISLNYPVCNQDRYTLHKDCKIGYVLAKYVFAS